MSAPAGQKPLTLQTPNSNAPLVAISEDAGATGLMDSTGKPVTGTLNLFGYITPAWRYLFGNFALKSDVPTGNVGIIANSNISLLKQIASVAATTLFVPSAEGLYRISMYLATQIAGNAVGIAGAITWNDGTGAQSATTSSLDASMLPNFVSQTFLIYAAAGNAIQYSATTSGVLGAGTYMLQVVAEEL